MSIGDRLRLMMEVRGETLVAFAQAAGVPYRTIQNYISGVREPKADVVALICTRLGVDGHWLLTGQGEMRRPERAAKSDPFALGGGGHQVNEAPNLYDHPAPDTPLARRIAALSALLAHIDPEHADAILSSALARATDAQRLADLERALGSQPRRRKRP